MSSSRWNRNYLNIMNGDDARKFGHQSRSAKRHEFDKHEALELYKRGLSDLRIAATLGVTKGDVYRWRKLNGLSSNMTPRRENASPSEKTKK